MPMLVQYGIYIGRVLELNLGKSVITQAPVMEEFLALFHATIAHAVQLKPVRKEVIDFKLSPFGRHVFYGVDIKE